MKDLPSSATSDVLGRTSVEGVSLHDCPELRDIALELDNKSFPDFLVENRTSEAFMYVADNFPESVVLERAGDAVLATAFSAPITISDNLFFDRGWENALGLVLAGGGEANSLFTFSISVATAARGMGLGGKIIEDVKARAKELGYTQIITPVRPTGIKNYPALTVDEYAYAVDVRSGLSIDPWVKTIQRHGGELAGVGVDSHVIKNDDGAWPSVAQWEEWTGMKFPQDGEYEIPGGCAKLKVHDGVGEYREDCIWVVISVFSA